MPDRPDIPPDPTELLATLDVPRALSDALRRRLEEQLLAPAALPLGDELTARLTTTLADPVAALLEGIDGPRPLSPALRSQLTGELTGHPGGDASSPRAGRARRRLTGTAVGLAAAAAAAVVVAVLVLARPGAAPTVQAGRPVPSATMSPTAASGPPGVSTGTGSVGGGQVVGPTPAPRPSVPAPQPDAGPVGAAPPPAPVAGEPVSMSPEAGPLAGGTRVVLTGQGLGTTRRVDFGEVAGTDLRVLSDSRVSVLSPAVSQPHEVGVFAVTDAGRVGANRSFFYLAAPHLDSASPSQGPGGTWVTLKGTALARVGSVRFGTVTATEVRQISEFEVQARAPAQGPGPVDITLSTPGGTSNATRYVYLP
jgi:hypothetical protein